MNWHNVRHEATCVTDDQYPCSSLPEVMMCGRSNVGKSAFINALVNRKNLARIGRTPGKTAQVLFFNVDDAFRIVDLPGYGYAKVSKIEQEKWRIMVERYLHAGRPIALAVMLIDLRREPSLDDLRMIEWMKQSDLAFEIVGTKADKFAKSKVKMQTDRLTHALADYIDQPVIAFSAVSKMGVQKMRDRFVQQLT